MGVDISPPARAAHELPHPGAPHGGGQASARNRVLDIQRARILGAMVEESAERGAANTTVAHIVERAGVSRRTFYELFTDREDCFLGAFDEGVARASRCVLAGYDPSRKWAKRIRCALVALLAFLDAEPATGRLLVVGSLGAGPRTLEHRGRVFAQLVAAVDQGRAESKGGAELPPLTAEGIVGGVLSVLHSRLLSGEPTRSTAARNGTSASPSRRDSATRDGGGDALSRGVPERGLLALTGPLMGMIVLPYLGPAASRRENAAPVPIKPPTAHPHQGNPLGRLEMRLTYRTVRVLMAIAAHPGSSNRVVAGAAEVSDQGQMSKLLARLQGFGLIANAGGGAARGEPNAWTLTEKGWQVQGAITEETGAR